MDFIIAKGYYGSTLEETYRKDVAILENIYELDMEIGEDDDFSFTIPLSESSNINLHDYIYSEFNEFGGRILTSEILSKENKILFRGETCRGLLKRTVISPDAGQEYLTVSGYFDDIVTLLLDRTGSKLKYLFSAKYALGYENYYIASYQIRYLTLYDALVKMLATINANLYVDNFKSSDYGLMFVINAVPITDFTNDFDFSQNSNTFFRIENNQSGINALMCLGGGVGVDRIVKMLYWNGASIVETNPGISNYFLRYEIYENVNDDTIEKLDEDGRKRLLELVNYKKTEITDFETQYNIQVGDVVGAYDEITGETISSPVVSKNLVISGNKQVVNYKLKEL